VAQANEKADLIGKIQTMAEYNFGEIERKWQKYWKEQDLFNASVDHDKPKYYVLDMFPYPSGAGLHVGHPLGYIATDIVARYKRIKGFNVFHPMGFDSFGLPAEQYAIKTGQHPALTTKNNIKRAPWDFHTIGTRRSGPVTRIITSGPNGSSSNYLTAILTSKNKKPNQLRNSKSLMDYLKKRNENT